MKKYLTFPIILVTLWLGFVIFSFVMFETENAVMATIFSLMFGAAIVSVYVGFESEKQSRQNPYTISENDAGKIFRVKEITNKAVGLVTWGHKDFRLQDTEDFKTFYLSSGIPIELREIGMIFKIEQSRNGLVFKKIQVNGFEDETKKPFEVLEHVYQ